MDAQQALNTIKASGIVAGMRGAFPPDVALRVSDTLMGEGINVFELMMNSEEPIFAMQALKAEYGEDACVGMGTVLDVDTAHAVLDAGADFVVSPAFQPEVVAAVQARGVLVGPGVATPSEAVAAWDMGVKLLKLFPIGALGIDYFRAIFGPLQHMSFMCNGAMDDYNAREFIGAGALACGMGGWLVGDGTWSKSRLRSRARILTNAVASARDGARLIEG
ncbi:MAG: bifunctional 4-hydroxy-2-oxoglutarate aldolase/2-dehydro-3-deoxy-phosphogluconate aldolase [Chloroflexota bacterium]|nr:bifunctional 4-hydroxy-2-oxoglutarate aldolase/2-dehydro-3-deoxy-phosphogluconate aldolase [Chloroflexota bacterium]